MLKFFKKLFLILFAIFFVVATCLHIVYIYKLYKTGELQNEFIPRMKYTLTDINLLFPISDYHKERRFMLWYGSEYIAQLNKLKSLKDGYVVSNADFENKDNIFSNWDSLHASKRTKVFFELLIYGGLSETQKQVILDFYKMRDNAYYELAVEVCEIKNPKSMKDFEEVQEKINKLTYGVGYPLSLKA